MQQDDDNKIRVNQENTRLRDGGQNIERNNLVPRNNVFTNHEMQVD